MQPSTSEVIEVRSPATGEYVGKVPMAAAADVDAACSAARKAFDEGPWPRMTPQERQSVIANAVTLITERADLFKFLLQAETGQPQMIVDMVQYGAALSGLQYYATAADKFTWQDIRDGIYGQTLCANRSVNGGGGLERADVPGLQQRLTGVVGRMHGGAQAGRRDPAERYRVGRGVRRGRTT